MPDGCKDRFKVQFPAQTPHLKVTGTSQSDGNEKKENTSMTGDGIPIKCMNVTA